MRIRGGGVKPGGRLAADKELTRLRCARLDCAAHFQRPSALCKEDWSNSCHSFCLWVMCRLVWAERTGRERARAHKLRRPGLDLLPFHPQPSSSPLSYDAPFSRPQDPDGRSLPRRAGLDGPARRGKDTHRRVKIGGSDRHPSSPPLPHLCSFSLFLLSSKLTFSLTSAGISASLGRTATDTMPTWLSQEERLLPLLPSVLFRLLAIPSLSKRTDPVPALPNSFYTVPPTSDSRS